MSDPSPTDDFTFRGSERPTLGVELELPVLDRDTGELAPGAPRLLEACAEEGIEEVSAELMKSMVEVRTPVCETGVDAHQQLLTTVGRVRRIANSMGYELALWGAHPFARATAHAVAESERYASVERRLAWMTSQRVTFGLHVHVGVRDGEEAVGVMNMLVQHLPHLLALSANSPFWQGVDTGFASTRSVLYGLVPHSGVPGHFESWRELREYILTMREGGLLTTHRDPKWDIRPRPDLGTIEFRVCDAPDSIAAAAGIAALTRALVVWAQRLLAERPHLRSGDIRRQWFAAENKWLAARYGMDAKYIRPAGDKRRSLGQAALDLIERMAPIADECGDSALLRQLRPLVEETGAGRQRRVYRETGEWSALVEDAAARLASEVKRPPEVMPAPAA